MICLIKLELRACERQTSQGETIEVLLSSILRGFFKYPKANLSLIKNAINIHKINGLIQT